MNSTRLFEGVDPESQPQLPVLKLDRNRVVRVESNSDVVGLFNSDRLLWLLEDISDLICKFLRGPISVRANHLACCVVQC